MRLARVLAAALRGTEGTATDILARWLGPDQAMEWEEPEEDEEAWEGHSSRAGRLLSFGPAEGGRLLPPILVDDEGLVDGRHRLFGARLAGLRYAPVVNLSQLRRSR